MKVLGLLEAPEGRAKHVKLLKGVVSGQAPGSGGDRRGRDLLADRLGQLTHMRLLA